MEILQLKYFSHAAKTENFSHTAQHFMVPTSCVSASIKKLENEIGVKLFERTANKIQLNQYGKILLQAVDKSEVLFNKAKSDIIDLSQTPCGKLRILIMTNRQILADAISKFKIKYPAVSFNIHHQWPVDKTSINEYDVIITDENIASDRFLQHFWLREEFFLAVHKSNPLSKKTVVSASDLTHEKFISMHKGNSQRNFIDAFFKSLALYPDIIIECDDPLYLQKYLKMGLGVTFFPAFSWKEQISNDISLLRMDKGLYRDSYIYTNKSSSNIISLFLQMLKSYTQI